MVLSNKIGKQQTFFKKQKTNNLNILSLYNCKDLELVNGDFKEFSKNACYQPKSVNNKKYE